ncbi:MAG: hypothetical protein SPJ28_02365 [Oscillospiraceae bacterium]|nr:hypothetical protein [Oscillospiraceae bacterium]
MSYVDLILQEAKIAGGETYWDEQPMQTFAAWGDRVSSDGSDLGSEIRNHEVEIELYELMDNPEPDAHNRLQATLDAENLRWTKEPREVDIQLRLYMTIYKFDYLERR